MVAASTLTLPSNMSVFKRLRDSGGTSSRSSRQRASQRSMRSPGRSPRSAAVASTTTKVGAATSPAPGYEGSQFMAGTIGQGGTPEKRPVVPYLGAVKVAAVVMAVMIVAGLGILGVTVAKRVGGAGSGDAAPVAAAAPTAVPTAFGEVTLQLPPRARILDMAMDQRRLVLHLQLAGRDKALMVVDLENGRSLGTITLQPDPLQP